MEDGLWKEWKYALSIVSTAEKVWIKKIFFIIFLYDKCYPTPLVLKTVPKAVNPAPNVTWNGTLSLSVATSRTRCPRWKRNPRNPRNPRSPRNQRSLANPRAVCKLRRHIRFWPLWTRCRWLAILILLWWNRNGRCWCRRHIWNWPLWTWWWCLAILILCRIRLIRLIGLIWTIRRHVLI